MSGTMGNLLGIRTHLVQPPYSVLCDKRSHIVTSEAGNVSMWTGATIYTIAPTNGQYLTLEDVKANFIPGADTTFGFTRTGNPAVPNIHVCPTRLISLENTLGGVIMPLAEAKRIVDWAHANKIQVHLDGARIWEVAAAGAGSLKDYCSLFDSVSLCFSKGLGAPVGSILVGSKPFIEQARWYRKSIGGGTRQLGVLSSAARVAVDEIFGLGPNGEGGKLRETHEKAKKIADMWTRRGFKLSMPVQTNMVWLDLEGSGVPASKFFKIATEKGLRLYSRLVIHYRKFSSRAWQTRLTRLIHIL